MREPRLNFRGTFSLPALFAGVAAITIASTSVAQSLRELADQRGIMFGAAAGDAFSRDTKYRTRLREEFNAVVAEYQMKFGQLQPSRGQYNWAAADGLAAFADSARMALRGHCLVWHKEAAWLESTAFSKQEMYSILKAHILAVVGRYKGKIPEWDVVNEAISNNPDSTYRDTFLFRRMGIEFIDSCFRWARMADPSVQLYYNEYWNEGLGIKSDKTFNLVKGLKERGVPIDGVGLQCHFRYDSLPTFADMDANIKRLAALGLKVAFTEVDYRIPLPATPQTLQKQKEVYQGTLAVCLANPNCKTFLLWGFTDAYSWIPGYYPGWGDALILDVNYNPKPAYHGLAAALSAVPTGLLPRGPSLLPYTMVRSGLFAPEGRNVLGRTVPLIGRLP